MENKPQKLKVTDLPLTIENVSVVKQMKNRRTLGGLMVAIALIPLFYGAYLIIFGPDHIMVNRFSGPTFWQAVRLNPGAVASLGFIGVAGGRLIRQSALKKVTAYINEHYVLINKFGKPAKKKRLIGRPTEDGNLVLQYRRITSGETPSGKQTKNTDNPKKYD
jgi:hypothetical protein